MMNVNKCDSKTNTTSAENKQQKAHQKVAEEIKLKLNIATKISSMQEGFSSKPSSPIPPTQLGNDPSSNNNKAKRLPPLIVFPENKKRKRESSVPKNFAGSAIYQHPVIGPFQTRFDFSTPLFSKFRRKKYKYLQI